MDENKLMPEIVQRILCIPDLSSKKPWSNYVNWIDQLCAVVNLIPCVGGTLSTEIRTITDAIANYRTCEFFRKFMTFIYELGDINDTERMKFLNEVEKSAEDSSASILISIIDNLDNINKQKILANLVKARCNGNITIEDFFRLELVLQRIPYVDLHLLHLYQDEYYDEKGDSELLYSTGVLRASTYSKGGDKYVLSQLGVNLLKYGLNYSVESISINGVSTEPIWESF